MPSTFPSTPLNTIASHTGPINALTFSSSGGTYILTGSSDRQIHLSRSLPSSSSSTSSSPPAISTTPIQRYTTHGYSILSLSVAASNATFASSDSSRSLFLWDVEKAITLRRFSGHDGAVTATAFAGAEDSVLVSGSQDTTVRLWDLKANNATKPIQVLNEARDGVSSVWVQGHELVSGSVDGRVRRYDLRMGTVSVDALPASVTSVQMTRDGNAVLVGCLDSKVRLLDCRDGVLLQSFGAEGFVNTELRLKSRLGVGDGVVVSGSEEGGLFAWDVLSGEVVWKSGKGAHGGKVASAVAWADGGVGRSGNVWASGGADGRVVVWGS